MISHQNVAVEYSTIVGFWLKNAERLFQKKAPLIAIAVMAMETKRSEVSMTFLMFAGLRSP